MIKYLSCICLIVWIVGSINCKSPIQSKNKMAEKIEQLRVGMDVVDNIFSSAKRRVFYDSLLNTNLNDNQRMTVLYHKGDILLQLGEEEEAIKTFESISSRISDPYDPNIPFLMRSLALAYLRLGERQNCVISHSSESCIMPVQGSGIHTNLTGSKKAIEIYSNILNRTPDDYESRWLINIAYMTIGSYPHQVPKKYLIENMDRDKGGYSIKPFKDVAAGLGLNLSNMSGGAIVEDFNNDGLLDVVISNWNLKFPMHFFQNNGNGGFTDMSSSSRLDQIKGGLNITQTDYNNDGFKDIFVFRGAWLENQGLIPNSLLRNNGDGTFSDVTIEAKIYSEHPTQTGVWADFNRDGWLDLFIGNESTPQSPEHPCELYLNDQKGHFNEVAAKAGCKIYGFIKGVTSADYDNDGDTDLFLSSRQGEQILLQNKSNLNNIPQFENVTKSAGLAEQSLYTFPTWFFDFDNDGWQDLFACGYDFGISIAHSAATEALHIPNTASKMYLFRNNRNGTFTDISKAAGLNYAVFGMGANYGDIDNDGFLDMYIGTGNPDYKSLTPNRLFRNMGNGTFADVTVAGRVGNIQKGHGVAFADLNEDGHQDIYIEMGGAYEGDHFNNALYLNPGQNENNWIYLSLIGKETNKPAIGSKIKLKINEHGRSREIHQIVSSGGSFGSSPLRKEIGIGMADTIDELTVIWQKTGKSQVFRNLKPNQWIQITEGDSNLEYKKLNPLDFNKNKSAIPMCKI